MKQHVNALKMALTRLEAMSDLPYAARRMLSVAIRQADFLVNAIDPPHTSSAPTPSSERSLLLLAADHIETRLALTKELSTQFRVTTASDGTQALVLARRINPDIIISDIMMPGDLEGDELCRLLKEDATTAHIPVIILSALTERQNIIYGLEAGAADYIIKPVEPAVLLQRLHSTLDMRFMERVMAIVKKRLDDSEFSINDLCRALAVSRTSLYNKVKELSGHAPNDFIRILRMKRAKELLETHRYPIAEVATMTGFNDPKYFSTCFRKEFGVSPSKYDKE